MAGVTVSGVLWAIFQNNAGGAWDNAKKSFEKGVEINGQVYYKKSEPHKAAVVGDTVGDPFKDTSGPSMNILIKLTSLVGLTIAPLIAMNPGGEECGMGQGCDMDKMECHSMMNACPESKLCEMDSMGNYTVDANVCASWMAEYSLDSTMCISNGNGRCTISKAAMEKIHHGSGEMASCGGMTKGMNCEMDTDGNCLVDPATCEAWVKAGKITKEDCISCNNGKCTIRKSAMNCSVNGNEKKDCCKK
jgi:hypothetical protein